MKTHKISQAALARRMGVDPARVSEWMNGRHDPSLESRLIMDEAIEQLAGGE
jgi:transcriptional regulator with XRE-family HTH domain